MTDNPQRSALLRIEATLAGDSKSIGLRKEEIGLSSVAKFVVSGGLEFCKMVLEPECPAPAKFLSPYLRQMSEQLIAVDYLAHQPANVVQELILLLFYRDISRLIEGQSRFFRTRKPTQPLVGVDPSKVFDSSRRQKLKELGGKLSPATGKGLPPTEQMAQTCGYRDLYDHIYRMTSKTVHFSLVDLLQSTWGSDDDIGYSAAHFEMYYRAVNQFYSAYLMAAMCARLGSLFVEGDCLRQLKVDVQCLVDHLDEVARWPEAVTYEEMNRPVPERRVYLRATKNWKSNTPPPELTWSG